MSHTLSARSFSPLCISMEPEDLNKVIAACFFFHFFFHAAKQGKDGEFVTGVACLHNLEI